MTFLYILFIIEWFLWSPYSCTGGVSLGDPSENPLLTFLSSKQVLWMRTTCVMWIYLMPHITFHYTCSFTEYQNFTNNKSKTVQKVYFNMFNQELDSGTYFSSLVYPHYFFCSLFCQVLFRVICSKQTSENVLNGSF